MGRFCLRSWIIQEVPDEDGVIMRAADDLKLIKLQSENSARVLLDWGEEGKFLRWED